MVTVFFNDFSLSGANPGVTIRIRNPYTMPKRQLDTLKLARRDGEKLTNAEYAGRDIFIEGSIGTTSRTVLEQTRDTFLANLQGKEGRLEFEQSGALRRYYCTFQDMILSKTGGGFAHFNLKFFASDPYGYDANSTTLTGLTGAITTTSGTKTTTFSGSGVQQPIITAALASLTGATGATATISNPATGQGITVSRNWVNSDSLVIDTAARTVKVNGTAVDYSGAFPEWQAGSGQITYTDTFSGRSVTLSATYVRRFL